MQVAAFLKDNKVAAPSTPPRVVIIGAGPAGLAAALHLQVALAFVQLPDPPTPKPAAPTAKTTFAVATLPLGEGSAGTGGDGGTGGWGREGTQRIII